MCNNLVYVDAKVNNKCVKAMLDLDATKIFLTKDLVVELSIPVEFNGCTYKAVNSVA